MCSENTNLAISQNQSTIDREISVSTQTNHPSISIEWSSNGTNTSVLTQSSFHEEIDKNLLKRVIQSSLSSSNTYRDLGWEADDDVYIANLTEKKHLTNILGAIKNGILKTIYYFSSRTKIGRVYVKLSNGFVALRRHIRHILARERYIDIDIENAHPTMISQLFEKECKLLVIPEYVANRNIFFEKISEYFNLTEYIDTETNTITTIKDQCKKYMSALFFGASFEKLHEIIKSNKNTHPDFVYQIRYEIERVYKKTIELNPWLHNFKKTKRGERGIHALFSLYMQEYERRILECVFMHLCDIGVWNRDGENNGSLCYDGFMVLKTVIEQHPTLLEDLQDKIKCELGFNLKWTIKSMDVPSKNIDILNTISINTKDTAERTSINEIEENFNKIVTEFEKSHFKVLRKGLYGSVNPDTGVVEVKSRDLLINMWRHISIGKTSSGSSILFIQKWLDGYDNIRLYQDIDVYPYPLKCPDNHYNLWNDFEIERRVPERTFDTIDRDAINMFRRYLLVLVNGVKEHRDWLERWIAHAIQRPGEKVGKCIVFIGKEGSGKTTLVNILRRIMGNERVRTYLKPDRDVFGDFNQGLEKCYIVNLNETCSAQTSGSLYENFKGFITDETVEINGKNKDAITVSSFHRVIVTTNNPAPITQADRNDRRFVVFRNSDELCGPVMKNTYWVDFHNKIVNNNDALRSIYDWYMTDWTTDIKWNVDTFMSEPSPITSYQKELQDYAQKPVDGFLIDSANNVNNCEKTHDEDIYMKDLYESFCNWSKSHGLSYIWSNKKFSLELSFLNIDGLGTKERKKEGFIFIGWNWEKIRNHYGVSFRD